jgi:hypothetical protein
MDKCQVEYYENVYPQKTRDTGPCRKGCKVEVGPFNTSSLAQGNKIQRSASSYRFCNDEMSLDVNNPNYVSQNQRLAGQANPKTFIAPVITPPPVALDYWRANNLINYSQINTESQYDTYLSGYEVSNCCDRINSCLVPNGDIIEGFEDIGPSYIGISDERRPAGSKCNPLQMDKTPIRSPEPATVKPFSCTIGMGNQGIRECQENCSSKYSAIKEGYEGFTCKEGTDARDPIGNQHVQKKIKQPQPVTANGPLVREDFEYPYATGNSNDELVRPNETGWINTMCGYNPKQIEKSNLPSNLAAGNCEQEEDMKQYNKNLFTQTIQPDVYTVNEVIEPINANIGISFTQQFEPTTYSRDERDALTYVEHDPRVYKPKMVPNTPDMSVTEANVYDPRFTGYGTSYRAYTHKELGQTRFYYDDVNAVRMPNYIVRSNIDFAGYADTYGPLNDDNKHGNKYTSNIRALAQDTFLRSSLQQRDDLMERLMRKRNGELWQLRKYPKNTSGVRC